MDDPTVPIDMTIHDQIQTLTQSQLIRLVINAAERCLTNFTAAFPAVAAPRATIDFSKAWVANPTPDNRTRCVQSYQACYQAWLSAMGANNQAAANAAHCAGCLANSFVTLPVVSSWIESVLTSSQSSMLAVAHDQAAAGEAAWVTAEIAGLSKA